MSFDQDLMANCNALRVRAQKAEHDAEVARNLASLAKGVVDEQEAMIRGQAEQIADLQNALIDERARANRAETYIRAREKAYPLWENFDVKSPYVAEAQEQLTKEGLL